MSGEPIADVKSEGGAPRPRAAIAVVVGGGCAGSLAAIGLADRGYDVVLVEKGAALPGVCGEGVPQAGHVHLLNKRGLSLLEAHWPTVAAALADDGDFTRGDFDDDVIWLGRRLRRLGPTTTKLGSLLFFHRRALDRAFAAVVRATPGIDVRTDCTVSALLRSTTRVESLTLAPRDGPPQTIELGGARDVVVYATGRFDAGVWPLLRRSPAVAEVPSRLLYRSVEIEADVGAAAALLVSTLGLVREHGFVAVSVKQRTGGSTGPRRLLLTQVAAGFGDGDADDDVRRFFDRFDDGQPSSPVAAFAATVRLLSAPQRFRLQGSRRLRSSSLSSLPKNVFVVGDGLASLNPVFGQGIGMCAETVALLLQHLDSVPDSVPDSARFARDVEPLVRRAFFIATLEDRLAALAHHRWGRWSRPLLSTSTALFFAAIERSALLHRAFTRTVNMLPPW